MKKDENNEQVKNFPVREGSENSSVLHDKKPAPKDKYPYPVEKDKQVKNQPEFTEEQPNRKSASSPAESKP